MNKKLNQNKKQYKNKKKKKIIVKNMKYEIIIIN